MIARHRGDTRQHSRWRPAATTATPPATEQPEPERRLVEDTADEPHPRLRPSRLLLIIAPAIAVAVIAGRQHARQTPAPVLPATPRQWVDQWTAASADNPAKVCDQLFAVALAAAFKPDTGRTCVAYYNNVTTSSFRVRHILQDGDTAAIEARQVGARRNWGYFTMLLSHIHGGWQAVDIVPGGSVRPR